MSKSGAATTTGTGAILAASLVVLAAGCGTVSQRSAAHEKATPPPSAAPAMTVTPDTALTGGQPLRVRMTGFPLTSGSSPEWLGFETPLIGQWLTDPHAIWITTDGGTHWTKVAFR